MQLIADDAVSGVEVPGVEVSGLAVSRGFAMPAGRRLAALPLARLIRALPAVPRLSVAGQAPARAKTIEPTWRCDKVVAPGRTWTIAVKSQGDPDGPMAIRSDRARPDLRGSMEHVAEDSSTSLRVRAETRAIMPGRADLDARSASGVPAAAEAGAGFPDVMGMSCPETMKRGAEPFRVAAPVMILASSADGVAVEIRRTRPGQSGGTGGIVYVRNRHCDRKPALARP